MSTQWQLAQHAAQRYQEIVVPYLLGIFASALVDHAALTLGEAVLDVGCGTGAAARAAAQRVGTTGAVVGVDINPGMIAVAQAQPPVDGATIEYSIHGATDLPFDAEYFDAVVCAQVLQFVPDRIAALAQMRRVIKPGGRVLISAWCALDENPYFGAQVRSVTDHLGTEGGAPLRAGFQLSDATLISAAFKAAGFDSVEISAKELMLDLPPMETFAAQQLTATPSAALFAAASTEKQQAIIDDISAQLAPYRTADGVKLPVRSWFARAIKSNKAEI